MGSPVGPTGCSVMVAYSFRETCSSGSNLDSPNVVNPRPRFARAGVVFLGINYSGIQMASLSSVVTAWVTINPLEIELIALKKAKVDRVFIIKAKIENKGKEQIDQAEAQIFLPEELKLIRGDEKQEIGLLSPETKKFIFWSAKGEKPGNYIISVKVIGKLTGNLLSAEDSTMIEIKEKKKPGWWQRFFSFFIFPPKT